MKKIAKTIVTFYIAREIFAIILALIATGLALWFLFQLPPIFLK